MRENKMLLDKNKEESNESQTGRKKKQKEKKKRRTEKKYENKEMKKETRIAQGHCSSKSEHVLNFVFLSGKTVARSCRRCAPSEY
jgi:translation initiation factor IF-3